MFWGTGAATGPAAAPVVPSVTLLLERLRNATLLTDRREIVHELKVCRRRQFTSWTLRHCLFELVLELAVSPLPTVCGIARAYSVV